MFSESAIPDGLSEVLEKVYIEQTAEVHLLRRFV